MDEAWRQNLLEDDDSIHALLRSTRRVAVLGMKTEAQSDQPAFYVPKTLIDAGFEVVPVPVYYPEVTQILGRPVHRTISEIQPPPDLVEVFRRPDDIPAHLDDILNARPKAVWFQLGIRNAAAAERLAQAGIKVVQDRCMKVELSRIRTV